jgi:hypothetical protein
VDSSDRHLSVEGPGELPQADAQKKIVSWLALEQEIREGQNEDGQEQKSPADPLGDTDGRDHH